ncbi:hypothetical protein CY34DRAFT_110353 [Suillus luteus UH-Slu-Lm8-n1]|uniref:Uncharacterized protein n=1 Tax=Suillus luteus UH-Slu-Lm8-n1 TaxID=930992 RepID=A0A0D0AJ01_9AGAM|nr:hypothetical protein CY34DRAFT_110353 [Suillus luteus UH-Slu-Lm8-n1]
MSHQRDESTSMFDSLPKKRLPLRQIQEEFLQSRSEEFLAIRDPAQRPFFFSRLFSSWFARWPEEKMLFPGTSFYKLTPNQMAAVGAAVRKRRKAHVTANSLQEHEAEFFDETRTRTSNIKLWTHRYEKMGNRSWATKDQAALLQTFLPAYIECIPAKNYEPVLKKVWLDFFQRWPEREVVFPDIPADEVLSVQQTNLLAKAVSARQLQITRWYRWQTNVSRMSRTSGTRGVLKFDAVLAGGVTSGRAPRKMHVYSHQYYDKKVKMDADKAIRTENVTDRGPRLNKHLALTQEKFEAESEEVKEQVEKNYQNARAKFARDRKRLKAGKMPKVDEHTKNKAIRELGPMLDRVFRYLSHVTDGWKFSVLMAGPDPTKGGTAVYDYHIGELDNGIQFNTFCANFNAVQEAFLDFTNKAIAFEATLPEDDDEDGSDDDTSDNSEMNAGGSGGAVAVNEFNNLAFRTDSLHRISPDSESQELQDNRLALPDDDFGSDDFGSMVPGHLSDEVPQDQRSVLPDQFHFHNHDLNFGLDFSDDTPALIGINAPQFQASSLDFFTPNFVNTVGNLTTAHTAPQNDVPQFTASPLDSFTPNFVNTAENLTTAHTAPQNNLPQFTASPLDSFTPNFVNTAENLTISPQNNLPQFTTPPLDSSIPNFPSVLISDMPLTLPPPPTPPQTSHAIDVRLPAVPDEPAGPDSDEVVPSHPNRRRRTRASAVSEGAQQIPPPAEETRQRRARNVAFNRRELDNAIGTSTARQHVANKSFSTGDTSEGNAQHLNR